MLEGKATLQEIEAHYTLDDLLQMNEALDAWQEAKATADKQAAEKKKR